MGEIIGTRVAYVSCWRQGRWGEIWLELDDSVGLAELAELVGLVCGGGFSMDSTAAIAASSLAVIRPQRLRVSPVSKSEKPGIHSSSFGIVTGTVTTRLLLGHGGCFVRVHLFF